MTVANDGAGPAVVQLGVVRGISYGLFGRPDVFVPQARALGARVIRVYIYWSQVEPVPGEYEWSVVDALLAQLDPAVAVWVTVCSSSPWATRVPTDFQPPSPALDEDRYARFVSALVRRCAARVRYWQCNNEPSNSGLLWAGTALEYVHQLRVLARTVRAADPRALVVLGGCGYDVLSSPEGSAQREFFDVLAREGRDDFDLFSVHLYDDPYLVPQHIETARSVMRRHGYERPVVVGEYNGPTLFQFPAAAAAVEQAMTAAFAGHEPAAGEPVDMSTTELASQIVTDSPDRRAMRRLYDRRHQLPVELRLFMADAPRELQELRDRIACRELTQRALLAVSAGVDLLLCWQLAPEVGDYTDPFNIMDLMFGRLPLMDFAGGQIRTPRPLACAHRVLAALLSEAVSVVRVDDYGPEIYVFRIMLADDTTHMAAWMRIDDPLRAEAATRTVSLPWDAGTGQGTDVLGRPHPLRIADGRVEIQLSETPVFLSADPFPICGDDLSHALGHPTPPDPERGEASA